MQTFRYENSSGQMAWWPAHSFTTLDLEILDRFLSDKQVMPLIDIVNGRGGSRTVAMRHDVDHSIEHALKFAQWEHDRGYRSTYFLLHTAWYYKDFNRTAQVAKEMQSMGHEIGFHNDSIGAAIKEGTDAKILYRACNIIYDEVEKLTKAGFIINGCADHGGGYPAYQTEFWQRYTPKDFGFKYEAYQLMAGENYISDNRGNWNAPLIEVEGKQTHMLVHPCHWPL